MGIPSPADRSNSAPTRETILIVDDNETILLLVTNGLSRQGYRVLSASDGVTAIERYGRSDDDIRLLITDVRMPRMTGRELVTQMRALRPTMKVLYASGYIDDVPLRVGDVDPHIDFIQKPYTPSTLAARVRALLDAP